MYFYTLLLKYLSLKRSLNLKSDIMSLHIFRTDIKTDEKVDIIANLFKKYSIISDWSVDTDDIDNVLRVVSTNNLSEKEIIEIVSAQGFICEALTD